MDQKLGAELITRKTKKSTVIWLRIGAVATLALMSVAGFFFILNPHDPEDRIMGFVALGAGVLLCAVLSFLSVKIQQSIVIYEEGVIVKKGRKEYKFHFNQIAGLRDSASGGGFTVTGNFGIAGALIAGVASAVASNAIDAHVRKNRLRNLSIVPNTTDLAEVNVVNTGGDELSQIYTEWLIKQKTISKENLGTTNLSFGDSLTLNNGSFIHRHRKGDVALALADISNLEIREDSVMFFAENEHGKTRCLIDIKITKILNIDLLFIIYDMVIA